MRAGEIFRASDDLRCLPAECQPFYSHGGIS